MDFKLPQFLANGAEIFAFKKAPRTHAVVVAKTSAGMHPWVTWAVDEEGNAFWGHYFRTEEEAVADWEKR